jgi:hypothetical protein
MEATSNGGDETPKKGKDFWCCALTVSLCPLIRKKGAG